MQRKRRAPAIMLVALTTVLTACSDDRPDPIPTATQSTPNVSPAPTSSTSLDATAREPFDAAVDKYAEYQAFVSRIAQAPRSDDSVARELLTLAIPPVTTDFSESIERLITNDARVEGEREVAWSSPVEVSDSEVVFLQCETPGSWTLVVQAASDLEVIDRVTAERLVPVLGSLEGAWAKLAERVLDLSWGSEMVPQETLRAADQLRESFKRCQNADVPIEDQVHVVDALAEHLASSLGLSASARSLLEDGNLRAPARAINRALRELPGFRENLEAVVSPSDLLRGASMPLPPEARSLLRSHVDRVSLESGEAARRGSALALHSRGIARAETPFVGTIGTVWSAQAGDLQRLRGPCSPIPPGRT